MKTANFFSALIILTLIVDCHELIGQDTENLKYDKSGNIKYLKFVEDKKIGSLSAPSSSGIFFSNILAVKEPNKFTLKTRLEHNDGSFSEIYTQTYNNIQVERGIYSLQFVNGKISKANGHFVKIEGIITKPKLTPEEASKAYSKYLKVPDTLTIKFLYGIVIAEIKDVSINDNTYKAKLCYKIDLLDKTWDNGNTGYVDALSGEVLKTVKRYNDDSATGTFNTLYNTSSVTAGTQSYNNTFNLCDSSRGAVIHTWDLNNTYYANYSSNRVEFSDGDNIWTTGEHSANHDQMAQDIHWGLQEIYDYFYDNHFNFSSFDNNNHGIDAYAHAVFDGDAPRDNACYSRWSNGYQAFFFGDGQFLFNPVASLDAVSHEYAHAITYNFTGLQDDNDVMDAINEGLSDIWGAVIEHSIAPNKDCWRIGEEIINVFGDDCLRNIEEPESNTALTIMADTYGDDIYNGENSTIYTKSGIMSHWFYLLVHGGTGVNDNGHRYCVSPVGIDAAAQILFRAHTEDFTSVENYTDARQATIDACNSWYVSTYHDIQVANAWYAVGVGNEFPALITGSNMCSFGTDYAFSLPEEFAGETITWNVTGNPYIVSGQGTRTVTLRNYNSGPATISATYNHGNGNLTSQLSFWAGLPSIDYIEGPSEGYIHETLQYFAYGYQYWTDFHWSISPVYEENILFSNGSSVEITYESFYDEDYLIICTPENLCGFGNPAYKETHIYGYYFMVYPNPASETITLTINEKNVQSNDKEIKYSIEKSDNIETIESKVYSIVIYNSQGSQVLRETRSGRSFSIQINSLKDGNYVIEINDGKKSYREKLIVHR